MKNGFLLILSLVTISVVFFSFYSVKRLKPADYFKWFQAKDCPVSIWQQSDEMLFNLNYRSKEYMALTELNGEEFTEEKFNTSLENYNCCDHFLLKIFAGDTISEALSYKIRQEGDYYERVRFLTTEFGSNTYLIDGDDTLNCTFSHFERTFKMRPYISMNLIFEKKKLTKDAKKILVIEPTIFNSKELRFEIDKNTLSKLPELKL